MSNNTGKAYRVTVETTVTQQLEVQANCIEDLQNYVDNKHLLPSTTTGKIDLAVASAGDATYGRIVDRSFQIVKVVDLDKALLGGEDE